MNNIMRRPFRERFSILIGEFGAGLAGRGEDLNEAINRANPALKETDQVLNILARQNRVLANLARDSDEVLAPLAREKKRVSSWIEQANATGEATAERRADIEASIQKLPGFLRELRPTMADLGSFAGQAAPVARDLNTAGRDISRGIEALGPFSKASTPAVESLGEATKVGRPVLIKARPVLDDLRGLAANLNPVSKDLDRLTKSLDETGGVERLMDFLYYSMLAVNGYDGIGHYLRAAQLANTCTSLVASGSPNCAANFLGASTSSVAAKASKTDLAPRLADDRAAKRKGGSVPPQGDIVGSLLGKGQTAEGKQNVERIKRGARGDLASSSGQRRADARLPPRERSVSRRSGIQPLTASPVLVGAVTLLVSIVAVFLSYNANAGLPFVPTYDLKAELPNSVGLVKGNEVRIGGARVGLIDDIDPVPSDTGNPTTVLSLKLDKSVEPVPVDSTLIVRPRSALGLKYVQLTPGPSKAGYEAGSTIPLKQATPKPVEIDELFNTFDEDTRRGAQQSLNGLGTGFAGRGRDLNEAISYFNPLLERLEPVATNLSDPRTRLNRLFRALGATASEVAPVAEEQASLFANMDTTFTALASVARPFLQNFISEQPPTYDTAVAEFPKQRPFLRNSAAFFRELRPGVAALPAAAPPLADAFEIGTRILPKTPGAERAADQPVQRGQQVPRRPGGAAGVERLKLTVGSLKPTLAFVAPAQTTCNYVTLFLRNAASLLSEGDANGTYQRFSVIAATDGPNNEGSPSDAPANGPAAANFLHRNAYPNTASPGQTKECEAGNERYQSGRKVIGNVPGNQGISTDGQKGINAPKGGGG